MTDKCHICGKIEAEWTCRDCDEFVCEDCCVPFTLQNQIDFTLCTSCHEGNEARRSLAYWEKKERLIRDGKIVGHKWTISVAMACKYIPMLTRLHNDDLIDLYCTGVTVNADYWSQLPITHDSFEQGAKAGDEWWFPNDKFSVMDSSGNTQIYTLIWDSRYQAFMFDPNDGIGLLQWFEVYGKCESIKRIGSAHDKEADNGK